MASSKASASWPQKQSKRSVTRGRKHVFWERKLNRKADSRNRYCILSMYFLLFCTDFYKCQMLKNDSCQVTIQKFEKTFYIKRHHLLEFKDCKWWFAEWPGTHSLPTLANHATILSCQVCHWHWRGGLSHYGSWQWSPHQGPRPGQPQEGEGAARDGGPLPRHAPETHQAQDQRGHADCSGTHSNVNTVASDWSSRSTPVLSLADLNSRVLVQGAEQLSVYSSPSPQRSVSSLGMQGVSGRLLSDTTKVSHNLAICAAINKYLPFCTKYKHSSCHKTPILCRRGFLHLRGGHHRRLVTPWTGFLQQLLFMKAITINDLLIKSLMSPGRGGSPVTGQPCRRCWASPAPRAGLAASTSATPTTPFTPGPGTPTTVNTSSRDSNCGYNNSNSTKLTPVLLILIPPTVSFTKFTKKNS